MPTSRNWAQHHSPGSAHPGGAVPRCDTMSIKTQSYISITYSDVVWHWNHLGHLWGDLCSGREMGSVLTPSCFQNHQPWYLSGDTVQLGCGWHYVAEFVFVFRWPFPEGGTGRSLLDPNVSIRQDSVSSLKQDQPEMDSSSDATNFPLLIPQQINPFQTRQRHC